MLSKHRIPGLLLALAVALPGLAARADSHAGPGPHGAGPMSGMGPMHEGEPPPGPQCDGGRGMGPMSGDAGEYGIGECIERHAGELDLDEKTRAAIRGVVETRVQVRKLLTPEQRAKLAELRSQGRERFAEKVEAACGREAERLCDEDERKLTGMMCLHHHRDEVSEACREALRPRQRGDGPGERCGGSGRHGAAGTAGKGMH